LIFFFQAEDGIRDLIVTGVQTCALPIFSRREQPDWKSTPPLPGRLHRHQTHQEKRTIARRLNARVPPVVPATDQIPPACCGVVRSEERRVGKQCRSRRAAYYGQRTSDEQ